MENSFNEKLLQLMYDNGFCIELNCTEEENCMYLEMIKQKKELPFDIARRQEANGTKRNEFYRIIPLDISHEELQEYCTLKQTKYLHTIKNCIVFFTTLTVITLIATLVLYLEIL